jgi:Putative transposase/Transposase zinc-binding domain
MNATVIGERPALEVADVIRQCGEAFQAKYALTAVQRQALRDLSQCRTAALGGHVEHCLDCGQERIAYNSCRNRHCPKCQALARARWLEREAQTLLPVEYHHVVFTLPPEVAALALANPVPIYDALFRAASATVRVVAANPKRLGAQVGMLMVLHTWGQNLHHHPHVHAVVTGGGLSCDERGVVDVDPVWRSCRPGFFLPVRVLSRVYRGKFLDLLRQAFDDNRLVFPGTLAGLAGPLFFATWLAAFRAKDWVVYSRPPFGGPAQVLKYLARYTHRVAISNHRLLAFTPAADRTEATVTFRYKDYADASQAKTMTLSAEEFLRRFVQHVLPKGFVKIRHYGLLASRQREEKLTTCRRLLLVANVAAAMPGTTNTDAVAALGPTRRPQCPHCGSHRLVCIELSREELGGPVSTANTS